MPIPTTDPVSLRARRLLPRGIFDYYAGAAGDERTCNANLDAFSSILFRPRCLIPVARVDTSISIPGLGKLSCPIIVAPMAMQRMAHPDGELAVARAVRTLDLAMVLSTLSNTSIEETARTGARLLFQLYVFKDRELSIRLLKRAVAAGYKAVVLTVDAPVYGIRHRDRENKFQMPPHLTLANFAKVSKESQLRTGNTTELSSLDAYGSNNMDANLSYEDLRFLVETVGVPVWVKGIVLGSDAKLAIEAGASAIVVSNHGGRQLEGVIPTMQALPEVVAAVQGRVPVLVDSGVRSGEDVIRAKALGATAVLVGRPVLFALAEGGEAAVTSMLRDMKEAVKVTMMLCGASSMKKVTDDLVIVEKRSRL